MAPVIVRLTASPALAAKTLGEAQNHLGELGRLVLAVNDPDLAISVASVSVNRADPQLWSALAYVLKTVSPRRFIRLELMSADGGALPDEDGFQNTKRALEEALSTVVLVSRRPESMQDWSRRRPFPWGRHGIDFGERRGPASERGCLGVSMEFGSPTIVYRARLENMAYHALTATCAAIGGPKAGFADVGAYPATSAVDGTSVIVVEMPETSRVPLHRVLEVIEIEARRNDCRIGNAALLSHVPLESLLGVLRTQTGLAAASKQIVETHLRSGASASVHAPEESAT